MAERISVTQKNQRGWKVMLWILASLLSIVVGVSPQESWSPEPATETEGLLEKLESEAEGFSEVFPPSFQKQDEPPQETEVEVIDNIEHSVHSNWGTLFVDPSLSEFPDDHQNRWERSPSDSLRHKASRKSRKKPKPSPSPRGDSRGCKVRTLHVRVRDLGLGYDSDEIVLFKYCAGSCQRARTNHDLTLSKLLQQKVIHSGRGEEKISAHPCCRPTRYEPVSFMDVQNTWQTVEKLSAAECSCVG
ncbi:artemin isoform X2 [Polypterus senegalus]|nr:artemin isoform X2 [Polypterus senegalus]